MAVSASQRVAAAPTLPHRENSAVIASDGQILEQQSLNLRVNFALMSLHHVHASFCIVLHIFDYISACIYAYIMLTIIQGSDAL